MVSRTGQKPYGERCAVAGAGITDGSRPVRHEKAEEEREHKRPVYSSARALQKNGSNWELVASAAAKSRPVL